MEADLRALHADSISQRPPARCGGPYARVASLLAVMLALAGCVSSEKGLDYRLIAQARDTIDRFYVDKSAVRGNDLTYGAISGMVDALGDTDHSAFLTPAMAKELKKLESGEFKGIGVEIQVKAEHVVIVTPLDDSPAQHAGLHAGDIILKLFGEDISGWPVSRVVERITGPAGTAVDLTVQNPRTGVTRQLTVKRANIKVRDVTWTRLPGTSVAHLRLASFDKGATRDLRRALAAIQRERLDGVILDLRNNPGGLLDEAVGVASQFLDGGNVLIAKDARGRTREVAVEDGGIATNLPMIVLINNGSASAAEIVAGALGDAHRTTLLGETTFGTGTVLGEFRLSDGSELLLAIEQWLTPAGHSFWHKGITPEILVPMSQDAALLLPSAEKDMTPEQFEATEDAQILAALKVLTESPEFGAHAARAQRVSP